MEAVYEALAPRLFDAATMQASHLSELLAVLSQGSACQPKLKSLQTCIPEPTASPKPGSQSPQGSVVQAGVSRLPLLSVVEALPKELRDRVFSAITKGVRLLLFLHFSLWLGFAAAAGSGSLHQLPVLLDALLTVAGLVAHAARLLTA